MKTLVLDIETTGLPPKNADYKIQFMDFPYIVSLAWKIDNEESKEFIINQEGRLIPEEATKLHGITNEMANASPHKLLAVLIELIGIPGAISEQITVIGHNIYFDTSTIKANILRLQQEEKCNQEFVDHMNILLHKDRRVDTMMKTIKFCGLKGKWPKLTELYDKCFPGETFDAHSSKNDVDATYKCYGKLKELAVI